MVQGLVPTILVGMFGALIAESIRLVPALRAGRPPHRLEYVASLILVALGGGAALFGWDTAQPAYKVAVLGAAFPLIFAASVNALETPPRTPDARNGTQDTRGGIVAQTRNVAKLEAPTAGGRSVRTPVAYLSGRF